MTDSFFADLKKHINGKLWEQIEVFQLVAQKLHSLNYPKALEWAQTVRDSAQKINKVDYQDLKNYDKIQELQTLKIQFENQPSAYTVDIIKKIDSDIATHFSNDLLHHLVDTYGALKTSFQEMIVCPLKENTPLLSDISSSLFVYLKLIEQQLTNLSGMLPKLIQAQTMIPALSSGLGEEKAGIEMSMWEKTKKAISDKIFHNLTYYLNSAIFDKIEQFTFNTKNFTRLFGLLHKSLPEQDLSHHAQNMMITNTQNNQLTIVAQQLEDRFSVSKLLNGAWKVILKKDEKRSDLFSPKQVAQTLTDQSRTDLDLTIDPTKMKFVLTNKIASFCEDLQSLLILLQDNSGTNFFNTLKMWHTSDKNLPLNELVLKKLYDQLKEFVTKQHQTQNIHIEKCQVICEAVLKSIDMVSACTALAQPFIDQASFGHPTIKNILLSSELFLGLQAIDENILSFDILKEKIQAEVAPEIYAPNSSGLEELGYIPKTSMKASSGKQKKALWSGFYLKDERNDYDCSLLGIHPKQQLYYLKHVTNYDFLADDLVEIIASNVATALGFSHRFAQCHLVRSKQNEVFVASLCTPGFRPLMNTEGRMTSRLTPIEKEALIQELQGTEKDELLEILALSLMLGDYDCNVGNVGRTDKQGLVKIDHGWSLEHICSLLKQIVLQQELDPLRYINRIAPTNNFNDYTKLIKTEYFLDKIEELIKRFDKQKINDVLLQTFDSIYQAYNGSNIPKGVDKSIFSLFGYDQKVTHFCFDRKFDINDLQKSLNERVGSNENLGLHKLATKIAETLELRLHLFKMILLTSLFKKLYSKKFVNSKITPSMLNDKRFEFRQKALMCFMSYFQSNLDLIMPYLRSSDQALLTQILSDKTERLLVQEKQSINQAIEQASLLETAAQVLKQKEETTLMCLDQLIKIYMQTQQNQYSFAAALGEVPDILLLQQAKHHQPQNIISQLLENKAPNVIVNHIAQSPYSNQFIVKLFLTRYKKELASRDQLDQTQVQQLLVIEKMLADLNQHDCLSIDFIDEILTTQLQNIVPTEAMPEIVKNSVVKVTKKVTNLQGEQHRRRKVGSHVNSSYLNSEDAPPLHTYDEEMMPLKAFSENNFDPRPLKQEPRLTSQDASDHHYIPAFKAVDSRKRSLESEVEVKENQPYEQTNNIIKRIKKNTFSTDK